MGLVLEESKDLKAVVTTTLDPTGDGFKAFTEKICVCPFCNSKIGTNAQEIQCYNPECVATFNQIGFSPNYRYNLDRPSKLDCPSKLDHIIADKNVVPIYDENHMGSIFEPI